MPSAPPLTHPDLSSGAAIESPELSEVVRQLLARIRRSLQHAMEQRDLNLSVQAAHVIILTHATQLKTPMQLACQSGYDKAVITRVVKQLLAEGLLNKHKNTQDKRSINLTLTAQGEAVHQQLQQARLQAHQEVFAPLNADELLQVKTLLQKCIQ
ncbi:MarR family winged helix-turn-helix transcriptional regulator [Marinagarivorans algicola]|uniref:MarR family winged helix-turn-helix transcriptional regulator n=1 Tax=Marinagarivorans algicola TaxID=1513270 RepID=UPI0006B539EE|nr:MarR family transcriptional regulator [Marinagarivorans algicola]